MIILNQVDAEGRNLLTNKDDFKTSGKDRDETVSLAEADADLVLACEMLI